MRPLAIKLVQRVREPGKISGPCKPVLTGHEDLPRELTAAGKGIRLADIRNVLIEGGRSSLAR